MVWTLPIVTPDKYDVFARWGSNDSGASNANYAITHAGGTNAVTANQNEYSGFWNKLGTFDLTPGAGQRRASALNTAAHTLRLAQRLKRL